MQLFDRLQTKDEHLNRVQDRVKSVVNAVAQKPIVDGLLITATGLNNSTVTSVPHGLGRVPQGVIQCTLVNDTIYETAARDNRFLYLKTLTVPLGPVNFWVF
jgi:hypothetical protein